MQAPPQGARSLRFKAVAAAAVLVVTLLGLEGLARFVAPIVPAFRASKEGPDATLLNAHPTRLWYTAPGTKRSAGFVASINALGLRGELPADPKPADVPRVLVLGDSSLFGHGVADDETYPAQLERALLGRGVRAEVINGGTPGYSTEQTRLFLDEVGWGLDPDLLIVGNLWSDNNFDWFQDADLLRTAHAYASPLASSALYRLLAAWGDRLRGGRGARIVSWTEASQERTEGGRRVPLPRYAENLSAIADEAATRGIGVMFLALTNIQRLTRDDDTSWTPYFSAQREVAAWYGAPIVDAHIVFKGAAVTDVRDLFVDAMHPSELGFDLLAKNTARRLSGEGWPTRTTYVPRAEPFPGLSFEDPLETAARSPGTQQEDLFYDQRRVAP